MEVDVATMTITTVIVEEVVIVVREIDRAAAAAAVVEVALEVEVIHIPRRSRHDVNIKVRIQVTTAVEAEVRDVVITNRQKIEVIRTTRRKIERKNHVDDERSQSRSRNRNRNQNHRVRKNRKALKFVQLDPNRRKRKTEKTDRPTALNLLRPTIKPINPMMKVLIKTNRIQINDEFEFCRIVFR